MYKKALGLLKESELCFRKKEKKDGWVDCVFPESQKVFDIVSHRRLVKKLNFQAGI